MCAIVLVDKLDFKGAIASSVVSFRSVPCFSHLTLCSSVPFRRSVPCFSHHRKNGDADGGIMCFECGCAADLRRALCRAASLSSVESSHSIASGGYGISSAFGSYSGKMS